MEHVPLPDHRVGQVGVSVKLVLYQVVQHLQEEEHQLVVCLVGEQEPGRGERLDQVEQLASSLVIISIIIIIIIIIITIIPSWTGS